MSRHKRSSRQLRRTSALFESLRFAPKTWRDDAACGERDPDWWFAGRAGRHDKRALAICNGATASKAFYLGLGDEAIPPCPVRDECLAYAIDQNELEGVWGGHKPIERRRLAAKTRRVS
jgi:WhiB family redox-sensing transcriptional regulator